MELIDIPREIVFEILLNLPHLDILHFTQTCREYQHILDDISLWRRKSRQVANKTATEIPQREATKTPPGPKEGTEIPHRGGTTPFSSYLELLSYQEAFRGAERFQNPSFCLYHALRQERNSLYSYFLTKGAEWDRCLYMAASLDNATIIPKLLDRGALDIEGALDTAAQNQCRSTMEYLMSILDPSIKYRSALMGAAVTGNLSLFVEFVTQLQPMDTHLPTLGWVMFWASVHRHVNITNYLIPLLIENPEYDGYISFALDGAAYTGDLEYLEQLISQTPHDIIHPPGLVRVALSRDNYEMAEYLISLEDSLIEESREQGNNEEIEISCRCRKQDQIYLATCQGDVERVCELTKDLHPDDQAETRRYLLLYAGMKNQPHIIETVEPLSRTDRCLVISGAAYVGNRVLMDRYLEQFPIGEAGLKMIIGKAIEGGSVSTVQYLLSLAPSLQMETRELLLETAWQMRRYDLQSLLLQHFIQYKIIS